MISSSLRIKIQSERVAPSNEKNVLKKKSPKPKQSHNIATCSTQQLYIGAGMLLPARPPESPFPVCAQILSCSHLTGQLSSDLQLISRTVASLCSKRHSHRRKIRFLFWKAKKKPGKFRWQPGER